VQEHLDGDIAVEVVVVCLPHLTHPTLANALEQPIPAKDGTGFNGHAAGGGISGASCHRNASYRSGETARNKALRRDSRDAIHLGRRRTIFVASDFAGDGMQKSLSDARARQELLDRLDRLTPDATPRWGTMTAERMLAHLADWMLMASGEIKTAPRGRVLRYPPLKQLAIYWLPFPRGVATSPELIGRAPLEWGIEHASVCQRVESFENLYLKAEWPEHPVFGQMSPKAWGVFAYRHMDHHLRQFGI